ncbi:hypothetical protein [uncultured Sphingomonas sp.]|uniref:hypothetical protein n=1 Tax=uncultured Sphingomonas sp. TaxID=158754 RepID=UPI0035CA1ABF
MRNRTPAPSAAAQQSPAPDFTPVPRLCKRHDGWTPDRQRAFIEALAETGSAATACRMVNMSLATAYALRHHAQGSSFARAWEAALRCGVERLRDEAFDRAMNGQLHPVISAGKVIGYKRVKNDRLLMYMLRHYGQDANGKRVTLNYFSAKDAADPVIEDARHAALPAPAEAAATLADFAGVPLDAEAQGQMLALLQACAARNAAALPEDDPTVPFVREIETANGYAGTLEPSMDLVTDFVPLSEGENSWESLHEPDRSAEIAAAVASVEASVAAAAALRSNDFSEEAVRARLDADKAAFAESEKKRLADRRAERHAATRTRR